MLDVTITDGGADTNKASMDECSFGVIGKCLPVVVHVESESLSKVQGIRNKSLFLFIIAIFFSFPLFFFPFYSISLSSYSFSSPLPPMPSVSCPTELHMLWLKGMRYSLY